MNLQAPTGCEQKNGPPNSQIDPLLGHFYKIFQHFDRLCVLSPDTKKLTFDLFHQKFQKLLGKTFKNVVNMSEGSLFCSNPVFEAPEFLEQFLPLSNF